MLGNKQLSEKTLQLLKNKNNKIFVSQVSLFEIAIKQKIKKLPDFKYSIKELIQQLSIDNFILLPILNMHIES